MKTLSKWGYRLRCRLLHRKMRHQPYQEFYRAVMSLRTADDPREAVGGMWEEMGLLQLEFLIAQGLQPDHRLLDLGCGCLRGGLGFINYLQSDRYVGVDISPDILAAGREFLEQAGLQSRNPQLIEGSALDFDWHQGPPFDVVFAQSLLSHMPIEDIEKCFSQIPRVLKPDGRFFATFFESEAPRLDKEITTFYFPFSFLRAAGERQGLTLDRVDDFQHPRGQKMLKISRQRGTASSSIA